MSEFLEQIQALKDMLRQSRVVTFFGGAGVSVESGLPDFRSEAAISAAVSEYGYPPEVLLSHDFFMDCPDIFYAYYKNTLLQEVEPNAAHYALAKLEAKKKLNAVITQNIDGLHFQAGSKKVYAIHGSADWNRCMECNRFFDRAYIKNSEGIPRCPCGGIIKPEVTLYGEPLEEYAWRGARACLFSADTLIVGGTSLSVYPAANLLEFFMGKHIILINKEETSLDREASLIIREPIATVLGQAVL